MMGPWDSGNGSFLGFSLDIDSMNPILDGFGSMQSLADPSRDQFYVEEKLDHALPDFYVLCPPENRRRRNSVPCRNVLTAIRSVTEGIGQDRLVEYLIESIQSSSHRIDILKQAIKVGLCDHSSTRMRVFVGFLSLWYLQAFGKTLCRNRHTHRKYSFRNS